MSENVRSRIEIIKHKLPSRLTALKQELAPYLTPERLSKRAYYVQPYVMNSPLTEEQIQDFEGRHSVQLPEDYRLFYKEIGNGGAGPGNFGLYELTKDEGDLSKPFPYIASMDWMALEETVEDDELDRLMNGREDGWLSLCSWGCGEISMLIVTGPKRGQVWIDSEFGTAPEFPSFLDWYEAWINGRYDEERERWLAEWDG